MNRIDTPPARVPAALVPASLVAASRVSASRVSASRDPAARVSAARVSAARVSAARVSAARVLITDDEQDMRWMLAKILENEGFATLEAGDGSAALDYLRQGLADVLLLDLMLPGSDGLEVLREVRRLDAGFPVILITGNGSAESALQAGKFEAHGYLTKPLKNDELVLSVRMALANRRCRQQNQEAPAEPLTRLLVGQSEPLRRVLAEIALVAPTEFTVIIAGETGVGKELAARALHGRSRRAAGPFVPVDCGSIPPTLIESELFGHEKGAFTGADRTRLGSFETAAGGTLFLDEIGNLPLAMQAKLLRALQERQFARVGGRAPLPLDARVLVATNENLADMVEAGLFRRDLFYRLNEFNVTVPPLRERGSDILLLAQAFLCDTCQELQKTYLELSAAAREVLLAYPWPGNIRELRNVIRRAALVATAHIGTEQLGLSCALPSRSNSSNLVLGDQVSFKEIVRQRTQETEREVLLRVLQQTGGNLAKAARVLRIDYKTMRTKAKQYHIDPMSG